MARRRSRMVHLLVFLLVRLVICIVQALSWPAALRLARALAWLAYRVDRRHRLVAEDNVRHAFPELDAAGVARMVRASYEHLATVGVEMIRMPRTITPANVDDFITCFPPHQARLDWACSQARPILVLTGHFGNWEVLSYTTGMRGIRGPIVARRLDNPYLDAYVKDVRKRAGMELLDKNEDYARILDAVRDGRGVGMVGDQDAGPKGLFVEFFGRQASTFKSIALLSLEYGAAVLVCGAARVGQPMRYRYYLEDLIFPEDYAQRQDAVRAITQRYTVALERMVRRHPEQYFWLHRRWKHQPKARRAA